MDNVLRHKHIHEATVLMYRDNEQLLELSKGGMTSASLFPTASVSKLYTHAMIFWLIDQKKITYETKLAELLPEIAGQLPYGNEVTVRHMIDQTSGFANYETDRQPDGAVLSKEILKHDRRVDFAEALHLLKKLPPKFRPGAGKRAYYADSNALLLGKLIEQVLSQSLQQSLDIIICEPLGLMQTHYFRADDTYPPVYNGKQALTINRYLGGQGAQGGVMASNAELMLFIRAFFGGKIFDPSHIKEPVFRPIQFVPMKYGNGMMQLAIPRIFSPLMPTPEIRGHGGSTGSFAYYCPSKQAFITGTVNQVKSRPYGIIYKLLASF